MIDISKKQQQQNRHLRWCYTGQLATPTFFATKWRHVFVNFLRHVRRNNFLRNNLLVLSLGWSPSVLGTSTHSIRGLLRRKLTVRVLHGTTFWKFVIFCCRFLRWIQKLATCCKLKKSKKVDEGAPCYTGQLSAQQCCEESWRCKLSRVTSP